MTITKHLIRVAGVLTLSATLLLAQGPGGWGAGRFQERGKKFAAFLATYLELTDAQKEQARSILEASREAARPVAEQLRQGHEAVQEAIKAGKSDAELEKLAAGQGVLVGQLAALRAKTGAKLYALLTPEQKEKAEKLREMGRGMFQKRITGSHPPRAEQY